MKTQSVRMTDIKVGQTFKTTKDRSLQRVILKGAHENDFYVFDPLTFVVEKLTVGQAWDTTVQLDIPSRWTANYPYNSSYFLNDDPNCGPNIWQLYYSHDKNHWQLGNKEFVWVNHQVGFENFIEAEDWANKIVDSVEGTLQEWKGAKPL